MVGQRKHKHLLTVAALLSTAVTHTVVDATTCNSDSDCTSGSETTCAYVDGTTSQCVDCTPSSYFSSCDYWSDDIKSAANTACGLDCQKPPSAAPTPAPTNVPTFCEVETGVECCSDSDCSGGESCSTTSIYSSQCIDCTSAQFQADCPYWEDYPATLAAAEATCGLVCGLSPTPDPTVSFRPTAASPSPTVTFTPTITCAVGDQSFDCCSDSDCSGSKTCVRTNGYASQCIDCSNNAFFTSCDYWGDDVKSAAEGACGKVCDLVPTSEPTVTRTPAPTGNPCNLTSFYQAGVECCSDSDCNSGKTCITQSIYVAECKDCTKDVFLEDCEYWSDAFVEAAEDTCGHTCGWVEKTKKDNPNLDGGQMVAVIIGSIFGSLICCFMYSKWSKGQMDREIRKATKKRRTTKGAAFGMSTELGNNRTRSMDQSEMEQGNEDEDEEVEEVENPVVAPSAPGSDADGGGVEGGAAP